MLSVSAEKLRKGDPIALFFTRRDSQRAARALLSWLKGKGGRCSKAEMSMFAFGLEAGRPIKFSRTNFYRGVLRRFLDLGLISEESLYDSRTGKVTKYYRIVAQPIKRHRPISPSFAYVSHLICEDWNREFVAEDDLEQAEEDAL